jgi:DDE superfamily endonuclease
MQVPHLCRSRMGPAWVCRRYEAWLTELMLKSGIRAEGITTRGKYSPNSRGRVRTPVLRHPYRRGKQLSMCAMVAYRPGEDGGEPAAWMGFDLLEGAYDTRQCIRVLDGLGYQLGHQTVTVIWDNLGAHHAADLVDWVATQPWLELAYLPSYALELDPVKGLWANLKGCELANRCCAGRRELIATARSARFVCVVIRICCAASWRGGASLYKSPTTAKICSGLLTRKRTEVQLLPRPPYRL